MPSHLSQVHVIWLSPIAYKSLFKIHSCLYLKHDTAELVSSIKGVRARSCSNPGSGKHYSYCSTYCSKGTVANTVCYIVLYLNFMPLSSKLHIFFHRSPKIAKLVLLDSLRQTLSPHTIFYFPYGRHTINNK